MTKPTTNKKIRSKEEQYIRFWFKFTAGLMVTIFFLPQYIASLYGSELIFPNFRLLMGTTSSLHDRLDWYPLLVVFIIIACLVEEANIFRSIILLSAGLFPLLLGLVFNNNLFGAYIINTFKSKPLLLLMALALLGIYLGTKITIIHGHKIGNLISGISGATFIVSTLFPLGSSQNMVYFALYYHYHAYDIISLPGSSKYFATLLIASFLIYLYSSFMAAKNLRNTTDPTKITSTSTRIHKLVVGATIAYPVTLLLVILFGFNGSGKMYFFYKFAKEFLETAGIIVLIALSGWDLTHQYILKTVKNKPRPEPLEEI